MSEMKGFINAVAEGNHLTTPDAGRAFQIIMNGGATPAQIAAILMGLRCNGETADEISGAAMALRHKMKKLPVPDHLRGRMVDTCGTGGDKKGTYNISTTVAFVVAACGVPVAKHGNKAVSSRSGSADVLKALGVNIDADEKTTVAALEQAGICFMMAPHYHSAMRHVGPIRQEMGVRTIFNLLGPLINPAMPDRQLMGVYDKRWVEPMARVLDALGARHAWVVHGSDGMDEITLAGETTVAELKDGEVRSFTFSPEKYGFELLEDASALAGGDDAANAQALRGVLKGKEGPYLDTVLLNAAAALVVSGVVTRYEDGLAKARQAIAEGHALKTLEKLVEVTNKV